MALTKEQSKLIYMGLVSFFKNTTYRFTDNEEAITLLLSNYHDIMYSGTSEDSKIIANVIQNHFTYCGDREKGYVYEGIKLIKSLIKTIPKDLVEKIISCYDVAQMLNNIVQRKQMIAIITVHQEIENLKKFQYIDATYLIDILTNGILDDNFSTGLFTFNSIDYKFGNKTINLASSFYNDISFSSIKKSEWEKKITRSEFENYTWSVDINECILFNTDTGEMVIRFFIENEASNEIIIEDSHGKTLVLKYSVQNSDFSNLIDGKILNEIKSTFALKNINEESNFCFSYVYLKNFRTLNDSYISFTNEYKYDASANKLEHLEKEKITDFYGKNIKSLSCIVGKNGSGKTSVIEFLKNHFFEFLSTGMFPNDRFQNQCNTEFIVVITAGNKDYLVTNIEGVKYETQVLNEFNNNLLKQDNRLWNIFNFTNVINIYREEMLQNKPKSKEIPGFFDFSEGNGYGNEKNIKSSKDMMLIFLRAIKNIEKSTETTDFYKLMKKLEYEYNLSGILKDQITFDLVDRYVLTLSSGQLSRLSFLSKLYWCFLSNEGKEIQTVIRPGDTSIIFIDEGELYYHPEWQREFIYTLLTMLNENSDRKFQVILSTNSPFMLSDVVHGDIYYLPSGKGISTRSLGQNIHTLLSDGFFMDYTIGEYSRRILDSLFYVLSLNYLDPIDSLPNVKEIQNFEREDAVLFLSKIVNFFEANKSDINSEIVKDFYNKFTGRNSFSVNHEEVVEEIQSIAMEFETNKNCDDATKINILKQLVKSISSSFDQREYNKIFTKKVERLLPMIRIEYLTIDLSILIESIGEDVYRTTLKDMFEKCKEMIYFKSQREILEDHIQNLQTKLSLLKEYEDLQ